MEVSSVEFRANCFKILDQVEKTHQEVVITKRGKPVAELIRYIHDRGGDPRSDLRGSVREHGDLQAQVVPPSDWESAPP